MLLSKSKGKGCCVVLPPHAVLWKNGNQGMFYSIKSTGSLTGLGEKADVVPDFSLMET